MEKPVRDKSSELFNTILKNTSAIIGGNVAGLLLSLVSSILLVRFLGSEKLGQYSALYAFLSLFSCLTTFGMDQIVVRRSIEIKENAARILGTASLLATLFSLGATFLAIFISLFFGYAQGLQALIFIAAIDLLLLAPLRLPILVFQLNLKQWYGSGISIVRQITWIIVLALLIQSRAGLPAVILGRLFCSAIEALAIFFFAQRFLRLRWSWNSAFARQILASSWPIALSACAGTIYHRIDQVMLYRLTEARQLGYYVAAVNIAELFSIFPVALMSTMFPILAGILAQKERFERYLKLSFRYLAILIFGVSVMVSLGSSYIISVIYGQAYISSAPVLAIYIWSEVGVFMGVAICNVLIIAGRQKIISFSTILGAILNIALNILLIPKWGITGAAWATVISYTIAGLLAFLCIAGSRKVALQAVRVCLYPFFTALLCMGALINLQKMVALTIAPILYLMLLFVLRFWNKDDLLLISAAFRKRQIKKGIELGE